MNNPPGWSSNPSHMSERVPIVVLAFIGFCIASYLTLYQIDVLPNVWEPFFGDGSERVLNSHISELLPVPDAALGALGYLADAVTGIVGGRRRWKRMPWIVVLFGLAVGPLGMASEILVMSQPILVGAWCTLCLISAVISLLMIGPAVDEMLASLQYLKRVRREGHDLWTAFWGGGPDEVEPDEAAQPPATSPAWLGIIAQILILAAGVWVMASPAVLGYGSPASTSNRIVGPLLITVGGIAAWEHVRGIRWAALPVAAWMVIAPWILGFPTDATISSLVVAAIVTVLTLISGATNGNYGGGWSSLWSDGQRQATSATASTQS